MYNTVIKTTCEQQMIIDSRASHGMQLIKQEGELIRTLGFHLLAIGHFTTFALKTVGKHIKRLSLIVRGVNRRCCAVLSRLQDTCNDFYTDSMS